MVHLELDRIPRPSVGQLILLLLATLGCYSVVWLREVSAAVDRAVPERRIGSWYFPVGAALSGASLGLFLANLLVHDRTGWHVATYAVIDASLLFLVVWTFKVRNRVNLLLRSTRRSPFWLHGLWTAVFGVVYIQKQVNEFRTARSRARTELGSSLAH